ncbi:MAG: tyrosine-type recombinase/integrase [Alphaproteobacteria bacterium]|nr:tyrosine-type recombinase/integrase [Alphaproteobacteria bacterium]
MGRILEKAGIKDLRKHDLRHAFASFAIMAGLTLEEIGQLLGHLTPQTTKRYSHLVDSHRKKLTNAVGTQISSILQKQDQKVVNLTTRRNNQTKGEA